MWPFIRLPYRRTACGPAAKRCQCAGARDHLDVAALNTVEPPILELANARLLEGDKPWSKARMPLVEDRVRKSLDPLSARLGDADCLDGEFSAGDLMMVSVLLRLRSSGILGEFPNLAAYVARGEARPAYRRAFAAQLAVNTGKPPAG
jgi:glutathione S-transferase